MGNNISADAGLSNETMEREEVGVPRLTEAGSHDGVASEDCWLADRVDRVAG